MKYHRFSHHDPQNRQSVARCGKGSDDVVFCVHSSRAFLEVLADGEGCHNCARVLRAAQKKQRRNS